MEEMTFALEEEVFQAPGIPGPAALEENNTLAENKNKESDKAERRGEKKRKSSEKPAEKRLVCKSFFGFLISLTGLLLVFY